LSSSSLLFYFLLCTLIIAFTFGNIKKDRFLISKGSLIINSTPPFLIILRPLDPTLSSSFITLCIKSNKQKSSSKRIQSLVLVAMDQWVRRSVSRMWSAFYDDDSLDITFSLKGRAFTWGFLSISSSLSLKVETLTSLHLPSKNRFSCYMGCPFSCVKPTYLTPFAFMDQTFTFTERELRQQQHRSKTERVRYVSKKGEERAQNWGGGTKTSRLEERKYKKWRFVHDDSIKIDFEYLILRRLWQKPSLKTFDYL